MSTSQLRAPPIRVLVVDDSAFARQVIRQVLSRDPEIEVIGIARDGLEALEKIGELRPDVVTLDLVMPDLDGLGLLKALLPRAAAPKVLVVSVSGADTELALKALELGAVDVVTKPTPLPTDRLYDLSKELVFKVKAVASARPRAQAKEFREITPTSEPAAVGTGKIRARLVVIGTSTGGPQALSEIFASLPKGLPVPIAIALHIPAGYTAPIAARLTQLGTMRVREAANGMELLCGEAVLAPGGMHLRIVRQGERFFAEVSREPTESLYHPSVDILFTSAAETAGNGAIGVVLTGMGSDGSGGAQLIRRAGGRVIAESASSCVVYGMPRTVIEAGTANGEAALEKISDLITEFIYTQF